jgi:N-acetylglucosamine transport system permease protein
MRQGQNRFIFSFLAAPVAIYVVFVVLPYASSMLLAFTRWRGVSANITFNGLNNFVRLAGDENFWGALQHNGAVLLTMPALTIALALFFAALFTQGLRGARFFRITFFFPQVMSVSIIAVLWGFIYHPTMGLLSGVFRILGVESLRSFPWLGDSTTVLAAIIGVAVWQAVGFYMVLFISGMKGIPDTLYEAARIDGAGPWALFWHITLPLLWETIRTALIFLAIGAMDMFAYVSIMTNETGGPGRAAEVLPSYLYAQAFRNSNFGYAAAIAVVLLLLVLGLSILSLRFTRRDALEY